MLFYNVPPRRLFRPRWTQRQLAAGLAQYNNGAPYNGDPYYPEEALLARPGYHPPPAAPADPSRPLPSGEVAPKGVTPTPPTPSPAKKDEGRSPIVIALSAFGLGWLVGKLT
jgi:hypothetical protein